MLSREDYIRYSLEINLFFLRLAKEHAIFAAASLPPRDINVSYQLIALKNSFEMLLCRAVILSQGVVSPEALSSMEVVTNLTLPTEVRNQFLTGIPIDMNITKLELALEPGRNSRAQTSILFEQVSVLNRQAITGLNTAIALKEKLLADILSCKAFSYVYPDMLSHIITESRFFTNLLVKIESMEDINSLRDLVGEELKLNWNEIMGDHAKYIRGYLDPSEVVLFKNADSFAKEFDRLPPTASIHQDEALEIMRATTNLRNFKMQGTQGILSCSIRSLIPPLLSDHVAREANHYLRLLNTL